MRNSCYMAIPKEAGAEASWMESPQIFRYLVMYRIKYHFLRQGAIEICALDPIGQSIAHTVLPQAAKN
jgi:hypothetical protein